MTSSEFAARYRLLKNVATRGARSFLAQQVELGRMVMVHYLDAESTDQQAQTLARVQQLRPGKDKVLEIADVDGTPVLITLFISSFADFATWLDQVSPALAPPALTAPPTAAPSTPVPGELTLAFSKLETPPAPKAVAPSARVQEIPLAREAAPTKAPSEFTQIFGKISEPLTSELTPEVADAPTLIMDAVKPPPQAAPSAPAPAALTPREPKAVAAPPPPPPPPPPPTPTPDSSSGFTAIFGRAPDSPSYPAPGLPPASPIASSLTSGERVMPPSIDNVGQQSAPSPVPHVDTPPPASPQPGEFTQLFQRLSPAAGTPGTRFTAPPVPPVPSLAPDFMRPIEAAPRADLSPPPLNLPPGPSATPASAPVLSLGAPRLTDTPPPPNGPSTPVPNVPTPLWAGVAHAPNGDALFGGGGESEFTRILGRVPVPPPPPPPSPIAAQPPSASAEPAAQKSAKSMMPLILALNAVLLLTIAIVAYFVVRK